MSNEVKSESSVKTYEVKDFSSDTNDKRCNRFIVHTVDVR